MEDIARDVSPSIIFIHASLDNPLKHSIPPPPPPTKFCSSDDVVMLEDESGRVNLVGDRLKNANLVTGVIMGALGMETPNGDFEVVDICFAGMAPPIERNNDDEQADDAMDVDGEHSQITRDADNNV